MRISTTTLLLSFVPSIVTAADQVPLMDKAAGWFEKAKEYIPNAMPSIPDPIDAGAAAAADGILEKVNIRNWQRKLQPKLDGEEEWMLFLTGGNKSCFGRCEHVESVWNASVPLLKALPKSQNLKLGYLDCEKEAVLCTAWAAAVPAVYHFIFPERPAAANVEPAPTQLHVIPLNITTTTTADIVSIPRAGKSRYLEYDLYEGWLHPIDGIMRQLGLLIPLGYVLWGFGSTPSWLMMILISFISRQMMSRRMGNRPDIYGQGSAPAQPQAAGAAAPASPARPAGGAAAGSKKKK